MTLWASTVQANCTRTWQWGCRFCTSVRKRAMWMQRFKSIAADSVSATVTATGWCERFGRFSMIRSCESSIVSQHGLHLKAPTAMNVRWLPLTGSSIRLQPQIPSRPAQPPRRKPMMLPATPPTPQEMEHDQTECFWILRRLCPRLQRDLWNAKHAVVQSDQQAVSSEHAQAVRDDPDSVRSGRWTKRA